MAIDPNVVGREYPPFAVTIDAQSIREFAEAIRDDNPRFLDPDHEVTKSLGGITAPPTLSRNFWWEGFQIHEDLGFNWENVLHGEQEFEYYKSIHAGDVLSGVMRVIDSYEKVGKRGGRMTFAVIETTYTDATGSVALIGRRTLIERQREASKQRESRRVPLRLSADTAKVGDRAEPLVVGPLTRTDFVRYAGASGDFNPIHHDDLYAIRSGDERVFGMGMLTAGYMARLLEEWFGPESMQKFKIRFTDRAWPGDILTCHAEVVALSSQQGEILADCEGWVENQEGTRVISVDAVGTLT